MFSLRSDAFDNSSVAQLESLMEAAGDAVFRLDGNGEILYASQRAINLLAPSRSLLGALLTEQAAIEDRLAFNVAFEQTRESRQPSRVRVRLSTQAALLWVEIQFASYVNGKKSTEVLAVVRDITAEQATAHRLQLLSTHDELTGLPNRSLLADRLGMALAQARRSGIGFSILVLDLDSFKKINDALGHAIGDKLLQIGAQRLRNGLRDADTLARAGGDEFIAIIPGLIDGKEIQNVARRMISAMQMPFDIEPHMLYVGASVGAATYPVHGDDEVKLLAHADTAMHRAKETGKSRCVVYSLEKFSQPEHDVSMEAAMFDAVRNGEFLLHYQPIVDAASRQIMGFEALMRWRHPVLGLVSPMQFIPMAESNGLINLLGAWVLKAACVQIRKFEKAANRQLYVSVNVSPRQFRNERFLELMDEAIVLSGVRGEQLLLEITEGILMSDPEHAETLLHAITARKVRIAIDDFGTGYSSLAYLKRFPISVLKIDRAFIKDLPHSVKDAAICNVVLSLANHLDLTTVAEGVENEEQMAFLAKQGCGLIQGYLTGRPQLPEAALVVLSAGVPA
ncbi:MAG: EAL domain-containing protein [Pseudomonadota bacterium]